MAYTVTGTGETGEVRYKAFGASRFTSGTTPTSYRYTGQREEISFGLYYYGARWYDPALGRFTQADTIVPDPTDAKQYDRYAYVSNNPLKYTDPSGHCQTLQDGSRDTTDSECWALADQLYDKYDTNMCPVGCLGSISWGRNKWNIDRDVWMAAYAGAWSYESWRSSHNSCWGSYITSCGSCAGDG
jgi:RHS repeat-associated protein